VARFYGSQCSINNEDLSLRHHNAYSPLLCPAAMFHQSDKTGAALIEEYEIYNIQATVFKHLFTKNNKNKHKVSKITD